MSDDDELALSVSLAARMRIDHDEVGECGWVVAAMIALVGPSR
jgi:hypothetical protein